MGKLWKCGCGTLRLCQSRKIISKLLWSSRLNSKPWYSWERELQEKTRLNKYQIQRNATIYLNLRLRGGVLGTTSINKPTTRGKGMPFFKAIPRVKASLEGKKQVPDSSLPGSYIVEKTENIPELAVEIPEVTGLFDALQTKAVICQFNGFWPKLEELHAWIHQN